MEAQALNQVLANHRAWLKDPTTGKRANLRGADLAGAYLRGADLRYAYLRDADLRGARMADVILSGARGIIWSQRGPIGMGVRTHTAIWCSGQVVHHAGCFTGTRPAYETRIAAGGWDWPSEDADRLAARCRRIADECEADIHEWLSAC